MARGRRRSLVSAAEVRLVLDACGQDSSPRGSRDAVLIYFLATLGVSDRVLRSWNVAEIAGSDSEMLARVAGVDVPAEGQWLVQGWLDVRGRTPGPLLNPVISAHTVAERALSRSAIVNILARRCRQAGVPPFSPEDLASTRRVLTRSLLPDPAPYHDAILCYLGRLRRSRRRDAERLLDTWAQALGSGPAWLSVPWTNLTRERLALAMKDIGKRLSPRRVNALRSALASVLRSLCARGLLNVAGCRALFDACRRSQAAPKSVAPGLDLQNVIAMLEACARDQSAAGARDGAMIALMWCAQLSVSGTIRLPRTHPLRLEGEPFRHAVRRWIEIRGRSPGTFLLSISRQGQIVTRPATRWAVLRAFQRRAAQAGLAGITPEQVRMAALRHQKIAGLEARCP
jgi:integrase